MKCHILFKRLKELDEQLREVRFNIYNKAASSYEQKTAQIINTTLRVFILKY